MADPTAPDPTSLAVIGSPKTPVRARDPTRGYDELEAAAFSVPLEPELFDESPDDEEEEEEGGGVAGLFASPEAVSLEPAVEAGSLVERLEERLSFL